MKKMELDEFVNHYGFNNTTDIAVTDIAMTVTKIRKDKENGDSI